MERDDGQMTMTVKRGLTGGQSACFFFLGFLGGGAGALAAYLMCLNLPYRAQAAHLALAGFLTAIVLAVLLLLLASGIYIAMPIAR